MLTLLVSSEGYANYNVPDTVRALVGSVGTKITPETTPRWLLDTKDGRRQAYDTLRKILGEDPPAGSDWIRALDLLAVVSGADAEFGPEALGAFVKFAQDDCYYGAANCYSGSSEKLTGAPRIAEWVASAKSHIPFAIVTMARSAKISRNWTIFSTCDEVLADYKSGKTHWDVNWIDATSTRAASARNQWLLTNTINALAQYPHR